MSIHHYVANLAAAGRVGHLSRSSISRVVSEEVLDRDLEGPLVLVELLDAERIGRNSIGAPSGSGSEITSERP